MAVDFSTFPERAATPPELSADVASTGLTDVPNDPRVQRFQRQICFEIKYHSLVSARDADGVALPVVVVRITRAPPANTIQPNRALFRSMYLEMYHYVAALKKRRWAFLFDMQVVDGIPLELVSEVYKLTQELHHLTGHAVVGTAIILTSPLLRSCINQYFIGEQYSPRRIVGDRGEGLEFLQRCWERRPGHAIDADALERPEVRQVLALLERETR